MKNAGSWSKIHNKLLLLHTNPSLKFVEWLDQIGQGSLDIHIAGWVDTVYYRVLPKLVRGGRPQPPLLPPLKLFLTTTHNRVECHTKLIVDKYSYSLRSHRSHHSGQNPGLSMGQIFKPWAEGSFRGTIAIAALYNVQFNYRCTCKFWIRPIIAKVYQPAL